ncbi:hypothetical protein BH09DEP1_BH09DEP1_5790 [soil metagenome]
MNYRLFAILIFALITSLIDAMESQYPFLRDAVFYANNERVVRGSLAPFVTGGTPPYLFLPKQGTNGQVTITAGTPHFTFTFNPNATRPGTFSYVIYTDNGMTNPATVTIYSAVEKG